MSEPVSEAQRLADRLQASSNNDDATIESIKSMDALELLAMKRRGGYSARVGEAIRQRLQRLS